MYWTKRRRAKNNEDYETWIDEGVCPTLNAFDNTGDSRATVIVFAPGPMVRLGGNIWEGTVPTLRAEAKRGDAEPHIAIINEPVVAFDNSYRDGLRIQKGETINTLSAKMGSGGNNVPFVAIPIHDQATRFGGKRGEKQDGKGNGLGVGQNGDPMLTLTQGDRHAVAEDTKGEEEMQVRRLTPIECERLMGWPDNHTLHRADGKTNSDTTRYKMCGNGVASPVAQWIAQQINMAENGL